jgi:hypothetical protein
MYAFPPMSVSDLTVHVPLHGGSQDTLPNHVPLYTGLLTMEQILLFFPFSNVSIVFSVPGSPQYRGLTITLTSHSEEPLWTSDQPGAKTSTVQHTTLTRDIHPRHRRDWNPQS